MKRRRLLMSLPVVSSFKMAVTRFHYHERSSMNPYLTTISSLCEEIARTALTFESGSRDLEFVQWHN